MSASAFTAIARQLVSDPVRRLRTGPGAIHNWLEAMRAYSFGLPTALDEAGEILPRVNVKLLLNPLGAAPDALPTQTPGPTQAHSQPPADLPQPPRVTAEFPPETDARAGRRGRAGVSLRERLLETEGRGRASLVEAKGITAQPVRLSVVLRRYAGSAARAEGGRPSLGGRPSADGHPSADGRHSADGRPSAPAQTPAVAAREVGREREAAGRGRERARKDAGRAEGAEAKPAKILPLPLSRRRPRAPSVESKTATDYARDPFARFGEEAARRLVEWSTRGTAAAGERAGLRFARGFARARAEAGTGEDFDASREDASSGVGPRAEAQVNSGTPEHEASPPTLRPEGGVRRFAARRPAARYAAERREAEALLARLGGTPPGSREAPVKLLLPEPTPAGARLSTAVGDVFRVRRADGAADARAGDGSVPLVASLERIVEKLVRIETKFAKASDPLGHDESREEVAVRWMEEDDLASRLQNILRRQARRRGIDLS